MPGNLAVQLLFAAYSFASVSAAGSSLDFSLWDQVLQRHVDTNGELDGIEVNAIDYCGMKADPEFAEFVASLAAVATGDLSKNETYALYINAYNALAVNMIVQNPFPGGSCIAKIGNVPDVFTIPAGSVGGRQMSLTDIEDLLRDPSLLGYSEDCRVHGALVCMGISCPNLRAEAYVPDRIDEQMDDNMRKWLPNDKKGTALIDGSLFVSAVFAWSDADFRRCVNGPTAAFIAEFAPPEVAAFIVAEGPEQVSLHYLVYDHLLVGQAPCNCPVPATALAHPNLLRSGFKDQKVIEELRSSRIPTFLTAHPAAGVGITAPFALVAVSFGLAFWTHVDRRWNPVGVSVSAETLLA